MYLLIAFPSCLISFGSSLPPPVWSTDPISAASDTVAGGYGALTNHLALRLVHEMIISGASSIISLLPITLPSRHYLKNEAILARYK